MVAEFEYLHFKWEDKKRNETDYRGGGNGAEYDNKVGVNIGSYPKMGRLLWEKELFEPLDSDRTLLHRSLKLNP